MFVHWPPSQMLGLSSHSSISTGENQIKTRYLYAMQQTIIMASKHFNALINMVKIESLQITEQYIAKLSWWENSLSPAKVSGKTSPSDSSGNRNQLFLQRKEPQRNLCHTTRPRIIGDSWIQSIIVEINGSSEVKFSEKKYQTWQSLKKPSYMQNTSTDLKGGDKLETAQLMMGIITVHTFISLRDFYGLF